MELAIGIILIVAALFLIIAVLMQHGKDHNLSGTIAGASESFFGKSKSTTLDKTLSVLTSGVAVVVVILVLVMYLGQGGGGTKPADETTPVTTVDSSSEPADTALDTESAGSATESGTETEPVTEAATESAVESAADTEPAESVTEAATETGN